MVNIEIIFRRKTFLLKQPVQIRLVGFRLPGLPTTTQFLSCFLSSQISFSFKLFKCSSTFRTLYLSFFSGNIKSIGWSINSSSGSFNMWRDIKNIFICLCPFKKIRKTIFSTILQFCSQEYYNMIATHLSIATHSNSSFKFWCCNNN